MSTYKTNNPAVFTAFEEMQQKINDLRAKAKAFGERFGADEKHVTQNSTLSGYRISGFVFTPPKDTKMWTKPDREMFGAQRPRSGRVTGLTADEKLEHKALLADWTASYPKESISWEPVLATVGLTSSDLFFAGKFRLFRHDGWAYLKVGVVPEADHLVEILNSEFEAAERALDAANKEGKA